MISGLLAVTQGLADGAAMQNMAAQNQRLASSQLNAMAQGMMPSQMNALSQARHYQITPVRPPVKYAEAVQPRPDELALIEAEEFLEEVLKAGGRRRAEILQRVFAPDSPYRPSSEDAAA